MTKFLWSLFFVAAFFSISAAQEFKNLSVDEIKKMIDAKTKFVLLDVRELQEYRQGHIPTAINVPPSKYKEIETFLPKAKNTLVVIYCRGYG
ncbi:MAG: rhodanese-like domain-containing protein [Nitrospirae bacterium]|nr:rhodanese-like domain-containing protein [Nitrospirota bacterium]